MTLVMTLLLLRFGRAKEINEEIILNQKSGSNAIGTAEQIISGASGWVMLVILMSALLFAVFLVATPGGPIKLIGGALLLAVTLFCCKGLFTLEPNQAAVMIFFRQLCGNCL